MLWRRRALMSSEVEIGKDVPRSGQRFRRAEGLSGCHQQKTARDQRPVFEDHADQQ